MTEFRKLPDVFEKRRMSKPPLEEVVSLAEAESRLDLD